jgi:hypothetical protein
MGDRGLRSEHVRAARCVAWALTSFCVVACKAGDERPGVGTPGLEPPSMTHDAGGLDSDFGGRSGGAAAPVTPGDTTGGAMAGGSGAVPTAGAGGAAGASGAAGTQGRPVSDADAGVDLGPGDALFTGLWVIDQPSHALYEATLYELSADGMIGVIDTMVSGAEPWPGFVTGTVANSDASVRCQFEGSWRSVEARVVELDSACTDGVVRRVQIELPETADLGAGVMPIVRSVEGQSGFQHDGFPWSWRKCASRDDCPPF